MKKLMILACAMAMAVAAQASSVKWSFTYATDSAGADLADNTPVYLVAVSGYAVDAAVADLSAGTFDTAKVVDTATTLIVGNGAAVEQVKSGLDLTGAQSFYAVLMQMGDDGAYQWAMTGLKDVTMASMGNTGVTFGELSDEDGNSFVKWNSYTPSSDNVPEPTSGLLLLVGMGALALRRKRA